MAPDNKGDNSNRIPINFLDQEQETDGDEPMSALTDDDYNLDQPFDDDEANGEASESEGSQAESAVTGGGPEVAELVATRAELKRLEGEVKELKDALARRQADFENYRKRVERERTETYNRAVADIAAKLLPVLDNLKRALETEASVEASETDEFRHFLSGVDLIHKQLNGVLDALGVKPILAEGEHFDPHLHEAVVTEPTDDYEPDTVMQEIVRGYRLGDKLIRPALVKVATRK
ncbi:MAG TPA: nucleotide exchange factor GrpE [Pyrinomonadaceae bacterium]